VLLLGVGIGNTGLAVLLGVLAFAGMLAGVVFVGTVVVRFILAGGFLNFSG